MIDFIKKIYEMEGRQNFNPRKINGNLDEWYGNNCLVRYEYPISEGESSVSLVKVLFEELCKNRKVPDIEFFYNRRDFPIITKDETEPYNNIWGNNNTISIFIIIQNILQYFQYQQLIIMLIF